MACIRPARRSAGGPEPQPFGVIRNPAGEALDYTYHPGRDSGETLLVIGHGVTANKDRPFVVALAEAAAAAGISALRFSFSGNGNSAGDFREATVTKEADDLGALLDVVTGPRVCFAGHSMGAAVGLLRASVDERIQRLVSLAGMVDTRAFAERKFGDLVPGEDFMWDKPDCPLSAIFMADMRALGSLLDSAARIRVPWLLVHGDADEVVPIQDSIDAASRAPAAELFEIPGGDHVFTGDATGAMTEKVVAWLLAAGW